MKNRSVLFCVGFLGLVLLTACLEKDTPYRPSPPKPPVYPDLKEKDDIFEYLEMVWERREFNRLSKLLDDDFVFVFGRDDYQSGSVPDSAWNRTQEMTATKNLFEGKAHPIYGACTGISLNLTPEGPWIGVPQTEPPYAGETWHQRVAEYSIYVQTSTSFTLQGQDIKALFRVRWAEFEGDSIWRIIRWYDDVGG